MLAVWTDIVLLLCSKVSKSNFVSLDDDDCINGNNDALTVETAPLHVISPGCSILDRWKQKSFITNYI